MLATVEAASDGGLVRALALFSTVQVLEFIL